MEANKVSDFRIGNLIQDPDDGSFYIISELSKDKIQGGPMGIYKLGFDLPLGIPLTPELLERLDFSYVEESPFENIKGSYWVKEALILWSNGSEPKDAFLVYYADCFFGKYQAVYSRWINSVHTLQNIYHSFKGSELTLK